MFSMPAPGRLAWHAILLQGDPGMRLQKLADHGHPDLPRGPGEFFEDCSDIIRLFVG